MSAPSPLSQPEAWNLVSPGYAELLLPEFKKYARDVLARVPLKVTDHVLDVATGPGTLALLAAPRVARVVGIDFAEQMVQLAQKHVNEQGFTNVALQEGDAQTLPFPGQSFDAAFSMFGLIFFPDRARGLRVIHRVLRPGGTIALTSWVPFAEVPVIQGLFAAIGRHLNTPFGSVGPPPLGSADLIHAELGGTGFTDIEITRTQHTTHAPTMRAYWEAMSRSNAPLVLVRKRLGDGWGAFEAEVVADLEKEFGAGPQDITMPAWITVARR